MIVVITATFLLTITERELHRDFLALLFEAVSAFGTVGLSMSLTPELSVMGKLIITLVMYIGRLGPLTLVLALAHKSDQAKVPVSGGENHDRVKHLEFDKEGVALKYLAVLPYLETERHITEQGQETVVHTRHLYLHRTEIAAYSRTFPLKEVYDVSFRQLGEGEGIFYLHTKQGVYPYRMNCDPAFFISTYKQISRL
ncbi:potassium transporter TrkG [Paenibacillus mesotrionivorans]|uniref:Potassium transporter TrkG n=1 Tax=Paenibacillus mesotrionivorans TaxID=3160968 RepID=A0ACC7NYJ7_9BACL